jgi:hypothetical protein
VHGLAADATADAPRGDGETTGKKNKKRKKAKGKKKAKA